MIIFRGEIKEDSPELFENLIISEDVYISHNFVSCTSAPKENTLKKLDELTPSMSKDQFESKATNQNKDQINIFFSIKMHQIKILIMKQKRDLRRQNLSQKKQ